MQFITSFDRSRQQDKKLSSPDSFFRMKKNSATLFSFFASLLYPYLSREDPLSLA
jgi:hypothetical protein